MKNVFLTGSNIYLRSLLMEDLESGYLSWFNDQEVCKYNSHHIFPYTKEKAEKYINKINDSSSDLVLAILLKENNLHIGNVSLQNINYISRNAELAIIIGEKNNWGKGYSKEAATLIVNHGFSEMNLHRIYSGTSEHNKPFQKLAQFLGMKEEGRRREAQFKNGKYVDTIEYGILKSEFLNVLEGSN